MKILFINPFSAYVRGGGEINDLNLAAALRKKGQEVIHVDAIDPRKKGFSYPDSVPVSSVHLHYFYEHALKFPSFIGIVARAVYVWYFLYQLRRQQLALLQAADLILLTGKPMLAHVRRWTQAKVLLSVRGRNYSYMYPYYRIADGIIFWGGCADEHPESLKKELSFLALNPAIETDIFRPGQRDAALRSEMMLGFPSSVVLIYVGRLDPVHQVGQIIMAAAHVYKQCGHNVVLNIIGDGAERVELEALAARVFLGRVCFAGRLSRTEVARYLRAADVFIINPMHANHPIALKEALACGIYALSPLVGRVGKILGDSPNGRTFHANDFEDMCNVLDDVLQKKLYTHTDPEKIIQMVDSWEGNAGEILAWKDRHG